MKRFAALTLWVSLLGALLALSPLAHAQGNVYSLYLVPITPLDQSVMPGSTVQFAAMLDVPAGANPITLTLGAAVGYDKTVFDSATLTATPDTSPFAPKPSVNLWDLTPPLERSATSDGISTLQLGVGHTRQSLTSGGQVLSVPPGTYTIGTYSFPVRSDAKAQMTTVILPTALGKTGPLTAIDFLGAIDSAGSNLSTFAFPNSNGKFSQLTYTIGNIYSLYLVPITPLNQPVAPGSTVQFAAMLDVPAGANPITLTLGAAVGYDKTVFDSASVTATPDTSPFAPKPSVKLWDLTPPLESSATSDGIPTLQLGVGHTRQSLTSGGTVLSVPPGTYTLGTYSFRVRSDAPLQTTNIILPSALGKTGPLTAVDFLGSLDSGGTDQSAFTFPNSNGKYSQLNYTVSYANTTAVAFHVTFQGLASNGPSQPVTVLFHPTDNSGDITKTGTASPTVAFVARVPFNTYDIFVKSPKYLGVALRGVALSTATQDEFVTLLAGDANNDNAVDMLDFGILVNAYGSSINDGTGRYNANADFNSDGNVDIGDFNLLVESYSLVGYN